MKKSQNKRILEYLKTGEKLTPLGALERFGCFRLGARAFELKRQGYSIQTEMVREGSKYFACYSLRQEEQMALL